MTVRSDQSFARTREILQMQLVTDARSGRGIHCPECPGDRTQKTMIVRIAEPHLQSIVIYIADREFRFYPRHAQCFKLEPRHSARRILGEGLIHAKPDFTTGRHFPLHKMGFDYFVRNIHSIRLCKKTRPA